MRKNKSKNDRKYKKKPPAMTCRGLFSANNQTKSRQCRGKEEESDTACCIRTPEQLRLVRRDLVVCPPFWLLPRIETGDSFLKGPAGAPRLRPPAAGNMPAWALSEEAAEVWGISFGLSLSAPLYYQTIVAFLCGLFEQIANKERPRPTIPFTRQKTPLQCRRCAWRPWRTSLRRSSRRIPGSAQRRPP